MHAPLHTEARVYDHLSDFTASEITPTGQGMDCAFHPLHFNPLTVRMDVCMCMEIAIIAVVGHVYAPLRTNHEHVSGVGRTNAVRFYPLHNF